MKYLVILAFLVLTSFKLEFNDHQKITWDNSRRLTWNDFQGIPEEESDFASITDWGISMHYEVERNGFQFIVKSFFDKRIFLLVVKFKFTK